MDKIKEILKPLVRQAVLEDIHDLNQFQPAFDAKLDEVSAQLQALFEQTANQNLEACIVFQKAKCEQEKAEIGKQLRDYQKTGFVWAQELERITRECEALKKGGE